MTSFAADTIYSELPADLICTPYGDCEPCPADLLHEPFCQPFGSRRVMHCTNGTAAAPPPIPPNTGVHSMPNERPLDLPHSHADETLAWAACGRIVAQERADFLEFVACNVLFAALALFGVFTRARRMRTLQARQLAARIGLGRR
ncbi:hypothetical protein B0H17DRAFT_927283 [Mycena rosella]|uniref:Uncharacterized protein n=1 Tax=Mycena rosella TaxID=1033263 RepID=A0AAD7GN12_MYCRO|nr:hypothetical protein B0H17DRAFT_927283 [Mycena rosella]